MTAQEYIPQVGEYVVTAPTGRWFVLKDLKAREQMAADQAAASFVRSFYYRFAAAIVRIDGEECVLDAAHASQIDARIDTLHGSEIDAISDAYDRRARPDDPKKLVVDYEAEPGETVVAVPSTGRWYVLKELKAREQMAADEIAERGARITYYRIAMRITKINGVELPVPEKKKDLEARIDRMMGEEIDAISLALNNADKGDDLKNASRASESQPPELPLASG